MPQLRLVVASDQALVAEAVRVAMTSHGLDASVLPWDLNSHVWQRGEGWQPQLGLMVSDLDSLTKLYAAQEVVLRTDVRWLLLTAAPRGAAWGAMLESGVEAILPSATALRETVAVLERLARGEGMVELEERDTLVRRWQEERAEREQLFERVQSLTPRERTVLRLLFSGDKVRAIADLLGVSEATVRSHVRSMMRKMDVNSQLAAVAAFGWLQDEQAGRR